MMPNAILVVWWSVATAAGYAASVTTYWLLARFGPVGTGWPIIDAGIGIMSGVVVMSSLHYLALRPYGISFAWFNWVARTLLGYAAISGLLALWALEPMTHPGLSPATGLYSSGSDSAGPYLQSLLCLGLGVIAAQGAFIGFLQGQLLKLFPNDFIKWVFANLFALPVSIIFVIVGTLTLPQQEAVQPLHLAMFAILGGAASGAITGLALIQLLRQRIPY